MVVGSVELIAVAAACFAVVAVSLATGRTLGIAFRSRFIARRTHEPALYWMSIVIFGALGAFVAYAVVSVNLAS